MTLLVLLNELSCRRHDSSATDNAAALNNLVNVLRAVKRERSDVALVTELPLPKLLTDLSPGWQADGQTRERARFLRGLGNRAPFTSVLPKDLLDVTEYEFQGRAANGLGGAHMTEGLAASLAVSPDWAPSVLPLKRRQMVEDEYGGVSFIADEIHVRHASDTAHVEDHAAWLVQRGLRDVHSGMQLWMEKEHLFPLLRFLPRMRSDLEELNPHWLRPVKELLAGFQSAVRYWDRAAVTGPSWPGHVTPEHASRRALCRFHDPATGQEEVFDQHARFTPGPGRLHFRWDAAAEQAVIAYVGRKLGI